MVLHLLGQKSWNVYGSENQERVRRDETAARLKEEEEERRMQEADAERRMLELRRRKGMTTLQQQQLQHKQQEKIEPQEESRQQKSYKHQGQEGQWDGVKWPDNRVREISGDDQDYDTKVPVTITVSDSCFTPTKRWQAVEDLVHESLIGRDGHINLFQDLEGGAGKRGKLGLGDRNPEYEREKAEKDAKLEAQFTSRLGKPADELRPWYVSLEKVGEKQEKKSEKQLNWEKIKDQRGKDRNDPMQFIKNGLRDLKEVEDERRRLAEERKRELDRLKIEDRELENFSLDERGGRITTNIGSGERSSKQRNRRGRGDVEGARDRDSRNKDRGRETSMSRSKRKWRSYSGNRDRERSRRQSHKQISDGHDWRATRRKDSRGISRSRSPAGDGLSPSSSKHKKKSDFMMEKLRAEKDKRELLERQKAEATLAKIREDTPGYKVASGGRYSAQFIAR